MSKILINIKCDDKILIIAPHPDDECIGCGGLLSLYPEKCSVVVMTDGSQGNINVDPEQEAIIRKNQLLLCLSRKQGALLQSSLCIS